MEIAISNRDIRMPMPKKNTGKYQAENGYGISTLQGLFALDEINSPKIIVPFSVLRQFFECFIKQHENGIKQSGCEVHFDCTDHELKAALAEHRISKTNACRLACKRKEVWHIDWEKIDKLQKKIGIKDLLRIEILGCDVDGGQCQKPISILLESNKTK
jgi:hypothetical protein